LSDHETRPLGRFNPNPQFLAEVAASNPAFYLISEFTKDSRRIVKAERFAFQLPPRFLFLLWQVRATLEWLEVPSSSSEYSTSSSSSFGKLNCQTS
jgi:hypothetical protein